MIGYASRTGTRRNLEALRALGWRLMVSAKGVLRSEGFAYAIDNGAWTAHVRKQPFDVPAFERAVEKLGAGADWIVLPDIVAGGLRSLEFSLTWREQLQAFPLLLPVQDGMTEQDVAPHVGARVGVFIGGTTRWKLETMARWGRFAAAHKCHLHVGRVNTARRIHLCAAAGVDSFDGSGPSRYRDEIARLTLATHQPDLFVGN